MRGPAPALPAGATATGAARRISPPPSPPFALCLSLALRVTPSAPHMPHAGALTPALVHTQNPGISHYSS